MNNEVLSNKEYKLRELKQKKKVNEIESNKNNNISTSKENESYITDEIIQYCSSPKGGLVSINITKNNNKKLTQIPTDKNRITNTITINIAIKNELDLNEQDRLKLRTLNNNEENEKEILNNNPKLYLTNRIISENFKNTKCKSIFKNIKNNKDFYNSAKNNSNTHLISLERKKINFLNIELNKAPIKKNISKNKKKKNFKKSKDRYEEKKGENKSFD